MLANSANRYQVEYALFNRSKYHIGAIVTHFLKELGVDAEAAYRVGITPYEATVDLLQMDDSDLSDAAVQARTAVGYERYQERRAELMLILN